MKKGSFAPNLKLSLPPPDEVALSKFLTESGTFKDGDLLVNRDGVRIVSQSEVAAPSVIQPSDNQLCLADFEAVKVIGKGNGGIVRLVQHKWTGQFFALKQYVITMLLGLFKNVIGLVVLQSNMAALPTPTPPPKSEELTVWKSQSVIQMNIDESMRKHIAQELRINQSSQCPYVVICYQSFFDNGAISLILEYMDGGSLADFLKKVKTIPERYLAVICKQVLKGLWYLHHEKHIIHRDLKPSNLLINHRGDVKITDFGVSAVLASTSGLANTFVGTYNYMSPERISGGAYDYKSDIWSLGLVLLECATGHFPYTPPEGDEGWVNVYELMETIVDQPEPCAPPGQFSPQFCSFISACLEAHYTITCFSVQKHQKDRLSANELMSHPFITMYDDQDIDLGSYFTSAGPPLATLTEL
ncbi:hypothetical protein MTR67_053470 [Solanum verrucosum]|uniref:mitogen-activated protein kinase kinase n=1 Tax=Solanum verrucosum TaxID=315347 RepID=A0AAF0V7N3_SOLVR|nr:hypothetical protein MTR67_053470 [Solanum verrucosum]